MAAVTSHDDVHSARLYTPSLSRLLLPNPDSALSDLGGGLRRFELCGASCLTLHLEISNHTPMPKSTTHLINFLT